VNSEIDDVNTQPSNSELSWRRSGKHTRKKPGVISRTMEMASAQTTGQMSTVPTRAPTGRMISATEVASGR